MVALAIGVVWLSYYGGLYGYCLVRGYDVTPIELLSPSWPGPAPNQPSGGSGFGPGSGTGGGAGGGGGSSF